MKQITLNVEARNDLGRTAARHLRQGGSVPAVIYGESGNRHLTINAHEFAMAYRDFSGRAALIELKEAGVETEEPHYAIIQELQRDSRTDAFVHVDFKEIVRGQDMEADIPVQTRGIARGVKDYGGVLDLSTNFLRVRCRPRSLPESIVIDVSELEIGKNIRLEEIEAPEGVEFLDDMDMVLAACVGATASIEEEEAAAEEAAAAAAEEEAAETEEAEATPAAE